MKEYVPFDMSYWLSLPKDALVKPKSSKRKKPPAETLEKLLSSPITSSPSGSAMPQRPHREDILESIIGDRSDFLASSIKQLENFRQERISLCDWHRYRIEYSIFYHSYLLHQLDLWPKGYNSMVEKRRMHLEKLSVALKQEKRKEETACWQDILSVTRDLRQLLKEYMELGIRRKIILHQK